MNIEILSRSKKYAQLSFVLKDSTVAFANSLRRVAAEEVPTLAIEDIEFRQNNSVMYDEMLALRFGLLPIATDLSSYNLPEECPCKGSGCAQCQLKMTIKEKGEKVVMASDIKSQDPKIKPVFPDTPIVKLLKGQELEAELTAVLGQGKVHVKWSPGLVYYKYLPTIKISKKGEKCLECAKICPQDVFEVKAGKLMINEKHLMDCHLCGACEELSKGDVSVEKNVTNFVFYVESWGQMEPEEIMVRASEYLEKKLDAFDKAFKESKK
jgi:DNA-directed RNA polymerase subunit D